MDWVEETYSWRDDIMEITRKLVHEADEARLNNIAEHFDVDLSEIREFIEMKRKRMKKPQTNADKIRLMDNDELAVFLGNTKAFCCRDRDPSEEFIAEFKKWLAEESET